MRARSASLTRALGLVDCVGIGVGAVVGAGLFVVLGIAAGVAGPAFILSFIPAAIAATCNGLSSAQLARRYPEAGGTYRYGYEVLHPLAGFSAGWMFLASKIAAGAVVAQGLAAYLARFWPGLDPRLAALIALTLLLGFNVLGIQKTGRLNLVIVGVTLLCLLGFILLGLPAQRRENWQPFMPEGWGGVLRGAALLFFAFTGYARIATLGGEVREPARLIPRAISLTLVIATLLYLAVAVVAIGAAGAPMLAATSAPLEQAAGQFSSGLGLRLILVGGTSAMLGVLLSQLLGVSRMFYAMGERGDMPPLFTRLSGRGVPLAGLLVTYVVIAVLIVTGGLAPISAAASFTILLYYGICNLSALRQPASERLVPRWVPALGLVSCLVLALSLPPLTMLSGLIILAVGHLLRLVYRRLRPAPVA